MAEYASKVRKAELLLQSVKKNDPSWFSQPPRLLAHKRLPRNRGAFILDGESIRVVGF